MEIEWLSSVPASALSAALAMARGRRLIEPAIDSALRPAIGTLQADLLAYGCQAEPLLAQMIPLVVDCGDEAELAETALNKVVGRGHDPRCQAVLIETARQLVAAFLAARPRAAEELPLRIDPLRGQWEARGPGLLAAMRRRADKQLFVPAARVVLLHPVLGGGGQAHPSYDRVTFEGLLANPIARLPEVLRLGWLLGQLNFEWPTMDKPLERQRLELVGSLALIPVVLASAEDVELACDDEEHLLLALDAWLGRPQAVQPLGKWWATYQALRPPWPIALASLEALLKEHGCP